jgi:hypothetical protein
MRKIWSGVVAVLMVAGSVQAANRNFTGVSGANMNFSTAGNWDGAPVAADNVLIAVTNINGSATSAGNRAKVDSGFSTQLGTVRIHSQTGYGQGMAYAEVLSSGLLKAANLNVGNAGNAAFDGNLILRSGGSIDTAAANSGTFTVGGETNGMVGEMFVEAGAALFRESRVDLFTYGKMTFQFGSNSVSTLQTIRTTAGAQNTLNGLLLVDLAALTTDGTYTLINSSSANLLIGGTMRTWLDSVGGSYSNSGDFANANFQVIGGNGKQWTLALADGGQDLTLTIVPVVFTLTGSVTGGNGTVSPVSTNVPSGGSAEFVITASNYYRIASLTTNGTSVTGLSFDNNSTVTNFIWSNVQEAGALVATFTNRSLGDSEAVQKVLSDTGVFCQAGDSSNAVTKNLIFSTVPQDGVSFKWASSAPLIIQTNGVVYRSRLAPCIRGSLIPVTITATASKNGVSDSRTFSINIVPSTNASAPLYQGVWDPFWRAQPVIGEWLAGGQGFEAIPDYLKENSFRYQGGTNEIPFAGHLNAVRLIGGWNEGGGAENPVPADVADLVYKTNGILQYRWDKLALRLDPYINAGYTNLTLVLDNIPYCFVGTPVMQSYGQVGSPTNFVEWRTFVSNLCVKLVDLYGFETANNFRFRQGTEAQSIDRFAGTQTQYFKIYDYSAAAVKSVLPGAKFGPFNQSGGKANPSGNNVDIVALAKHCATGTNYATGTIGSPFDFISISDYIAQTTHPHNPTSTVNDDISFFKTVQAELPNPVSWEVHEFGILNSESGLATDEPGARGAAWDFHTISRLRENGISRWYHWGVFDVFRSAAGLHDVLTGHGWLLAVLDYTAGGEAFSLNTTLPVTNRTQVMAVGVLGGDRDWILAGIWETNRLNHAAKAVSIRVPQNLLRANQKVFWTSLNETNSAHYLIRKDLVATGMLNAAFSAVPEQLASIRDMTTNDSRSVEQDFLATQLSRYEQAIIDSLTLKPFPGTIITNNGDVVFTITLAPPETAVIYIGPDLFNPPSVSLTAPTNGAVFTAPASIALTADASDADGTITSVDFYNGTNLLGSDTTSSYAYTWTNVASGSYSLTARATDNSGAVSTSAVSMITVTNAVYPLTGQGSTGGSVSPVSTNVVLGNSATFAITASNYYRIVALTTNGTAVTGMSFDNNSTTTNFIWSNVQTAGALAATFTAQITTNPAASGANVPYSWLAGFGLTNYEADCVLDQDLDGLKTWQEYIAGTVPTNGSSVLKAAQNTRNVVTWTAQSNRVYSVYWSTNLMKGFALKQDNIIYPTNNFTNSTPDSRVNHYQIKVRLP